MITQNVLRKFFMPLWHYFAQNSKIGNIKNASKKEGIFYTYVLYYFFPFGAGALAAVSSCFN